METKWEAVSMSIGETWAPGILSGRKKIRRTGILLKRKTALGQLCPSRSPRPQMRDSRKPLRTTPSQAVPQRPLGAICICSIFKHLLVSLLCLIS